MNSDSQKVPKRNIAWYFLICFRVGIITVPIAAGTALGGTSRAWDFCLRVPLEVRCRTRLVQSLRKRVQFVVGLSKILTAQACPHSLDVFALICHNFSTDSTTVSCLVLHVSCGFS